MKRPFGHPGFAQQEQGQPDLNAERESWLAGVSGLLHGDVGLAGFYSPANERQGCQYSMIQWDFCLFVI